MGIFDDVKYKRRALSISFGLLRKSEIELNNLLFDLREKYKLSDDDWMTIEAAISILTQRRILEQQGLNNDDLIGGGSDARTV